MSMHKRPKILRMRSKRPERYARQEQCIEIMKSSQDPRRARKRRVATNRTGRPHQMALVLLWKTLQMAQMENHCSSILLSYLMHPIPSNLNYYFYAALHIYSTRFILSRRLYTGFPPAGKTFQDLNELSLSHGTRGQENRVAL